MKLVVTFVIMNRQAHFNGYGASSKLGRPCKGVIQVRNRSDGRDMLVISTKKDSVAYEYHVKRIEKIRSTMVGQGLATIEVSEPPMSIMLRQCNPEELKEFLKHLQIRKDNPGPLTSFSPNKNLIQSKSPSGLNSNHQLGKDEDRQNTVASLLKFDCVPMKRPRSPELSKPAREKVKKLLVSTSVSVTKRENYPKEFHSLLEVVRIKGIGLRKVDNRILRLMNLAVLDLSSNQIKCIKELIRLNCRLKSLTLANNQITSLPDDFFSYCCFSGLSHLDLSNNQLQKLPQSIVKLEALVQAKLNDNGFHYLPYNLKGMKSLRMLDISGNKVGFIPGSITLLELSRLDLSGNPAVTEAHPFEITWKCVGYSTIPTLFESACEIVMNKLPKMRFTSKNSEPPLWPDIVQCYINGGRYCATCGKASLRYKIFSANKHTSALCIGKMSRCMISPVSNCTVKFIFCYNCDKNYPDRVLRGVCA